MTDTSSVESFSPVELPVEVEPNHLTRYFTPFEESPSKSEAATVEVTDFTPISPAPVASEPEKPLLAAPTLPTRSLSHSKREHERLARARSIRSSTASTEHLSQKHHSSMVAPASLTTDDTTSASLSPPAKSSSRPPSITLEEPKPLSPFSRELQQLDEVAEEFKPGAHQSWVAEDREDRRVMQELGLKSYRVSEYIKEIQSFREGLWALLEEEEEEEEARQAAWI